MDKKQKKAPLLTGYLREFATIFSLTILFFSLTGKIVANIGIETETYGITTIHTFDGTGLPYGTILQLLGFSLIMAFLSRLIFSEYFAEKISFILRYIIFAVSTLFIATLFAALFNWLPKNNLHAWLLFVPVFFVSFSIAIVLSILVMKLEDKKYNKLLEEYKNKYKYIA